MNDQQNSNQKNKKSPSLQNFINKLVEDKDFPQKMDPQVIEKIKEDLYDLLQRTINAKIIRKLNEEDRKQYIEMLENSEPEEKTQKFIKEKIPDVETFLANVLNKFRKQYLGKI